MPYATKYGVEGPALQTMKRGTLRFEGFSARLRAFGGLGLLSAIPLPLPPSHLLLKGKGDASGLAIAAPALIAHQLGLQDPERAGTDEIRAGLGKLLEQDEGDVAGTIALLTWASLLSHNTSLQLIQPAADKSTWLAVDTLAAHLSSLAAMSFREGERDMCVLHHDLHATFPDGTIEQHTATLVAYGEPTTKAKTGVTAMSRTVGITAAIGVQLAMNGALSGMSGVHTPVHPSIVKPALQRLKEEGIALKESVKVLSTN
jgi:alpha-aminoadipic semialdehyde synthase